MVRIALTMLTYRWRRDSHYGRNRNPFAAHVSIRLMRLSHSCCILFVACLGLVRPAVAEIAYKTEITGVDRSIRNALSAGSQLVSLSDRPPPSTAALRRRAEGDLPQLQKILHDE